MNEAARRVPGTFSWTLLFSLMASLTVSAEYATMSFGDSDLRLSAANAPTFSDKHSKAPPDIGLTVSFTTIDHIEYSAEKGEVEIECFSSDADGYYTMGKVSLRLGGQLTWNKFVNDDGHDIIQCTFVWTWKKKRIIYDVYDSTLAKPVGSIVAVWSVTEVGLFEQLYPSGMYRLAVHWSDVLSKSLEDQ